MKINAKRKGLTLIEIVISIAIYGVLALLITEIMTLVNTTIRSTDQMTKRLAYEAKYADNLLTKDDNGTTFDQADVNVTIDYDIINKVRDSEGQLTNYTVGSVATRDLGNVDQRRRRTERRLNIDGSGDALVASQFTTNYNETAAIVYHEDTNYKFMTFDKAGHVDEGKTPVFNVFLNLRADSDKMTKIVIKGAFSDGLTGRTYHRQADGTFKADIPETWTTFDADGNAVNHTQTIFTFNGSSGDRNCVHLNNNALTESTQDHIVVELYQNVTSSLGNNLGEKLICSATLTYYTSIKLGDYTNYYTSCEIDYLGNQRFGFPQVS